MRALGAACILTLLAGLVFVVWTSESADRPHVVVNGQSYSIYAQDSTEIDRVSREVESSARRFKSLFGIYPPSIAVAVVSRPGMLHESERRKLGIKDKGNVLPVLPDAYNRASITNVYGLPDQPVVLSRIDPADVITVFRSRMSQFEKGDTINVLNGNPVSSMDSVISIYERIPRGEEVHWRLQNGEIKKVSYTVSGVSHALNVHAKDSSAEEDGTSNQFVAHEAGHLFYELYAAEYCDSRSPRVSTRTATLDRKGAPDWLDEMIASLLESSGFPSRSITFLQNREEAWIPLAEYFKMQHPLQKLPAEFSAIVRNVDQNPEALSGTFSIVVHRNTSLLEDEVDLVYYAQTHAFGEYLLSNEGPAFIGEMGRMLMCGGTMEDVLPTMRRLPRSLPALQQHWDSWLASQVPSATLQSAS